MTSKNTQTPEHKAIAREGIWRKVLEQALPKNYYCKGQIIQNLESQPSSSIDILAIKRETTVIDLKRNASIPFFPNDIVFALECKGDFSDAEYKRLLKQAKSVKKIMRSDIRLLNIGERESHDKREKLDDEYKKILFYSFFDVKEDKVEKTFRKIDDNVSSLSLGEWTFLPDVILLGESALISIKKPYSKKGLFFSENFYKDLKLEDGVISFYKGEYAWILFLLFLADDKDTRVGGEPDISLIKIISDSANIIINTAETCKYKIINANNKE